MTKLDQRPEATCYNRCYKEGETAKIDNQPHGSNPYGIATPEGIAWLDGWLDAGQYLRKVTA